MEVRKGLLPVAFTPRRTIPTPSGGRCLDSPVACEKACTGVLRSKRHLTYLKVSMMLASPLEM